jgi:protein ImuB
MRLDVTLARIKAIVGEECVGRAVLKDTHRMDGFCMEGFRVPPGSPKTGSPKTGSPKTKGALEGTLAAVRQLRPAERIAVVLRGNQPVEFVFRERRYAVERAYGPWVMSGEWWNQTLWGVEQWDLIARSAEGAMLCCCAVRDVGQGLWSMAALYD